VAQIISNKNHGLSKPLTSILGADKLDYVERDLYHCGLGGQGVAEGVMTHSVFRDSDDDTEYGVLYEGGNAVTNFLKTWWSAHQNVYLNKAVEIPRTMLQRAIYYTMSPDEREKLFDMYDSDVLSMIENSPDETARRLALNLRKGKHHIPFVTFKLDGYEDHHAGPEKVYTITKDESEAILHDLDWLTEKESELCNFFGVQKGSVLVTPSQDVKRMDPDNHYCVVFMGDKMLTPIGRAYPDFSEYLREESKRHYSASLIAEEDSLTAVKSMMDEINPKSIFFQSHSDCSFKSRETK